MVLSALGLVGLHDFNWGVTLRDDPANVTVHTVVSDGSVYSDIGLSVGVLHAAGFVLMNMSIGKVPVAVMYTAKATEPFFSDILNTHILSDMTTWGSIGSLFPIFPGLSVLSAT